MPTDAALLRAPVAVDENQAGRACGPELRGKHNFNLVRPGLSWRSRRVSDCLFNRMKKTVRETPIAGEAMRVRDRA
jgi:hypothetical protein